MYNENQNFIFFLKTSLILSILIQIFNIVDKKYFVYIEINVIM